MSKKILPTPEELRQLLRYEPETGKLFWKERPAEMFNPGNTSREARCSTWNKRYSGKEAFTAKNRYRYHVGALFDRVMMAHRVAWAIHSGEWPHEEIDHIDGVRSNNAYSNLRLASRAENCRSMAQSAGAVSRYRGVSRDPKTGRWTAKICVNLHQKHLGRFDTEEAAYAAYVSASKALHKDFSFVAGSRAISNG